MCVCMCVCVCACADVWVYVCIRTRHAMGSKCVSVCECVSGCVCVHLRAFACMCVYSTSCLAFVSNKETQFALIAVVLCFEANLYEGVFV